MLICRFLHINYIILYAFKLYTKLNKKITGQNIYVRDLNFLNISGQIRIEIILYLNINSNFFINISKLVKIKIFIFFKNDNI